jgi:hypothetical protein
MARTQRGSTDTTCTMGLTEEILQCAQQRVVDGVVVERDTDPMSSVEDHEDKSKNKLRRSNILHRRHCTLIFPFPSRQTLLFFFDELLLTFSW